MNMHPLLRFNRAPERAGRRRGFQRSHETGRQSGCMAGRSGRSWTRRPAFL